MPTTDAQAVQQLTEALIRAQSVTPHDAGCLEMLADRLADWPCYLLIDQLTGHFAG